MGKILESLNSFENSLTPYTRVILYASFMVLTLYFTCEFGVKIGKAIYYLTH
jgi:hypothetical protein